jgi:hypothetical protein
MALPVFSIYAMAWGTVELEPEVEAHTAEE